MIVLHGIHRRTLWRCWVASALLMLSWVASSHAQQASWLYPRGSGTALPVQPIASAPQQLSAFVLKWRSPAIAGDVQPVVADIVPNTALPLGSGLASLEVAAVVGGKLALLDASGRALHSSQLPPFAQAISCVADSAQLPPALRQRLPSLLFLQTAESQTVRDSFAVAYIAGYDAASDTVALVTRLTYDLRPYAPNLFAWVRPVLAMPAGDALAVYSVLGTTTPQADSSGRSIPFVRGMGVTRVLPSLLGGTFPIPDAGDNVGERMTVAPHVGFDQPSIAQLSPTLWTCALPCTPSDDSTTIASPYGSQSNGHSAYLFCPQLSSGLLGERFGAIRLDTFLSAPASKPIVRPYWVELHDGSQLRRFVLLAESYSGRDGSFGQAQLHLFADDGTPITLPSDRQNPPFRGRTDAGWSLAVGDLDGTSSNELLPFFPNNPGAEIVLTESSRELAVAGSRLMVLRYRSGSPVPKPSPAGSVLLPLDTIATFRITGWLAAVADLDGAADGKAEIVIADGSDLLVLRMRDYADPRFRTGSPFDTALFWRAPGEEITNVAIADLDGERRTDIVATTTKATYALGILAPNSLRIVAPSDTTASTTVCSGDTIAVRWRFFYSGAHRYTIAFEPDSGGTRRIVARDTLVGGDTMALAVPAQLLRGLSGRFIVWLSADSTVCDTSSRVSVISGAVRFDTTAVASSYTAGSRAIIGGSAVCIDSVHLGVSFDNGRSWQPLPATVTVGGGSFVASFDVPCIELAPLGGADTLVLVTAIGTSDADTVVSDTLRLRVLPAPVPLVVTSVQPGFCCEYRVAAVPSAVACSVAAVYVRYALSEPWTLLDSLATDTVVVRGRIGSSDTIAIRWACRNSCGRTDTTLVLRSQRLISAIAPNPVLRGQELCRILTTPRSTGSVTVRIFDSSDRLVRTLVADQVRIGGQMYCDVWDCRSDSGQLVLPGVYYVLARSGDGWESFEVLYVR